MEETNATVEMSVNVGTDANAADSGAITGEELFEKMENGATVEELNSLLEDSRQKADNAVPQEQEAQTGSKETAADDTSASGSNNEKTFTQKELDHIIGQRTRQLQDKHTSLIDDLAAVLGVDRGKVVETIRQQRYAAEAEAQGVNDVELYAKQKDLEAQNLAFARERAHRQYIDDITQQLQGTNIDMDTAVDNPQFVSALEMFYSNPQTRGQALQMAYNAVFFDQTLKQKAQEEKEKVIDSIKAGQGRVYEGAAGNNTTAGPKIDVNKLTDSQLEELLERARNGETVTF